MSTTDLKDFDCDDLMNDYIDYVNTGTANAMAIASQDTGSMINSVRIDSLSDGYYVYSSPSVLRALSHEKEYYTERYVEKGYTHWDAFDFFTVGFEALDDNDNIGTGSSWVAKGGRGRKGSGSADIGRIKLRRV